MGKKKILAELMLLTGILASGISVLWAGVQSPAGSPTDKPAANTRWHPQANRLPKTQRNFYGLIWGVDSFSVKSVESGQIVRFSYRVLDATKAKPLHDKQAQPLLTDLKAGVQLVVPSLEKIGQLRQTSTPETGKTYWMGFSNKGRHVKPGDRVSVEIGRFKIDGLIVQ